MAPWIEHTQPPDDPRTAEQHNLPQCGKVVIRLDRHQCDYCDGRKTVVNPKGEVVACPACDGTGRIIPT